MPLLEKLFHLRDHDTTVRTEVAAGATTYLTMAYIVFVVPATLSAAGLDKPALIAATCLVTAFSTALMGFGANVPVAVAPGLGLTAFFSYTLVLTNGVPWPVALGIGFWAGVLFLVLSLVGARERLVAAIPPVIVAAIPVGIGAFLLLIGLRNMGLVVASPATLVALGKFTPPVVISVAGLFGTLALHVRRVPGAILLGIVGTTLAAAAAGLVAAPAAVFSSRVSLAPVAFRLDILGALRWSLLGPVFALFYVSLFDSLGTLVACAGAAGLGQPDGKIRGLNRMLNLDAVAAIASSLLGTSPSTAYIESATGIAAGGRTGLTAVVTALLFVGSLAVIPLISVVPAYATAPALVLVGLLMVGEIRRLDFDKFEEFVPALLTVFLMPFSFSIATGLACGLLAWGLLRVLLGRVRDISPVLGIILGLSLVSLLL
ncbi:NCS2 family permease [Hymenobacter caeli]|uniref:AGZA family xanthine/uracil permease-like MFS transporter n=1 Tax=Hymenobacter caeli TaxID=2735894 RepID=A0ABX2FU23_9BACT|nr:NCS2 family permease [Hymenobacter caeli]NRT20697.1 AGZA family xanthine/uracil permease-like MFS transporter [Hymenobacter caeli]